METVPKLQEYGLYVEGSPRFFSIAANPEASLNALFL